MQTKETARESLVGLKQVRHVVFFNAAPQEIFELLMNEQKHAWLTGADVKIDPRVGGKFSIFAGKVSGVTTDMKHHSLIVQDWRGADWPTGLYSKVRFELKPLHGGRGCTLSLDHTGVPEDKAEEINDGWQKFYWTPMAELVRNEKVAVVRKFLEEFKNRAHLNVVDETWTENCVLHVPGFNILPGRDGQKEIGKKIFDAFSDVHVDVNDTIVEGDRVVERHTAHAVHKGEFMGIPATGRKVSWTENHIYRMENGLIAETWSEVSFHDVLRQISS